MKKTFTEFCKNYLSGIRRLRAARFGALASGACTAIALGALSSTAAAYHFDQSAASAMAPDSVGVNPYGVMNPSPGCGKHPFKTGTFTMTTTDGANRTRTFLIDVPATYNPNNGYSLNAVYHGAGGSSSQSYSWGLQNVAGASTSGIFVFPQGINYQNYGIGWDDTTKGYDIPFFDHMVKEVEAEYCIDTARVFAAGFSWGGDFVTALNCHRGTVLRAVAVNSATDEYGNNTNFNTYADLPCVSNTHAAVRYVHAVGGDSDYPAPVFATTSGLFQSFGRCTSATTPSHSSTSVMTCVTHTTCSKELIECSFNANLGHVLPPNWASDTWAFFQTFNP